MRLLYRNAEDEVDRARALVEIRYQLDLAHSHAA
jgi:hypothetical protein